VSHVLNLQTLPSHDDRANTTIPPAPNAAGAHIRGGPPSVLLGPEVDR
jgi:hypothetical protein